MPRLGFPLAVLVFALVPTLASAQGDLAIVRDVPWKEFRLQTQNLLASLETVGNPLSPEVTRSVRSLLESKPRESSDSVAAIQKLLDGHCLAAVHINPESRVKALRGPLRPALQRDRAVYVLVKIHNEGGVTHPLRVEGSQILGNKEKGADRWLEARIHSDERAGKDLTGRKLEYRILKLVARQAGKREATFAFDVGQGTQDLGYRAEVPVLFTVAP